jgi:type I restriction enzyme S subunit
LSYQNKTTGILNLQLERYLKESIIPVPSFEDQQRIATILDHADSIRRKNRQILEKYNELAQSVFYEMFGDPIKNTFNYQIITLKEACYSIKDGPHLSPKYVERGIPFISVNNIIKGFWDFSNLKFISQRDHELFNKKCNPRKGDILYSKGGTTGFAKYIDIDLEFSNWVHLAVLKFDREKINGRFLESMLNSPYCYSQSQLLTRGIANRDLVLGQMAKIKLLSPPIELQKKFSDINENIENQKVYVKQCLQKSEDLFQSLLQRAFRGEL